MLSFYATSRNIPLLLLNLGPVVVGTVRDFSLDLWYLRGVSGKTSSVTGLEIQSKPMGNGTGSGSGLLSSGCFHKYRDWETAG